MVGMENQNETPIERAVRLAKGQTRLAEKVGVTPQAVQQWVVAGKAPTERCKAIEKALQGEITRAELRPDVFGSVEEDTS